LRSIRFAKEIPGIDEIIANDFSHEAVKMIEKNVKMNGVEEIVKPNKADAM
jgi:tRNA (guanine26-N2/guanine27-N2)-dimethyltransferase